MNRGRFPTSGAPLRTLLAHAEHRAELQDTVSYRVAPYRCRTTLRSRGGLAAWRRGKLQRYGAKAYQTPIDQWSMDFMSGSLANGQRFRLLTLVDKMTRESPA